MRENSLYIAETKQEISALNAEILTSEKAIKAEEDKRLKVGRDMLASIEFQLEKVGKTESQVAEITVMRLLAEEKIDEATARQLVTKAKALALAKKANTEAETARKTKEAEAKAAEAERKSAAQSLEDRIKGLEKQGEQAYMGATTKIIDDLQRSGASQEQIQRAQAARAIVDEKALREKTEKEAKAAKKKDTGDKGFQPAFESLTSAYKRIATASATKPEDRTANATEAMAKNIKEMNDRAKSPRKGQPALAVMGT